MNKVKYKKLIQSIKENQNCSQTDNQIDNQNDTQNKNIAPDVQNKILGLGGGTFSKIEKI